MGRKKLSDEERIQRQKESSKKYRQSHKDEVIARKKKFKESNPTYHKDYYNTNKDLILSKQKEYNESHKTEKDLYHKEYNLINSEIIKQKKKQRRLDNLEDYRERDRIYFINNRDKRLKEQQKYREDNRDNIRLADNIKYQENKEDRRDKSREHYHSNKEKYSKYSKEYQQTMKGRYQTYKSGAKRRNLSFDITAEEFTAYWNKPCEYCGDDITTIGLDRIDKHIGYTISNIKSCCSTCNYMKYTYSLSTFLSHISTIVSHNKTQIIHTTKPRNASMYIQYKAQADIKDLSFTMSRSEFDSLLYKSCMYCGNIKNIGVDRVDSNIGYESNNTVSCCKYCNHMKKKLSVVDFTNHINKIYNHSINSTQYTHYN